jgi:hypothetical protein
MQITTQCPILMGFLLIRCFIAGPFVANCAKAIGFEAGLLLIDKISAWASVSVFFTIGVNINRNRNSPYVKPRGPDKLL